MKLSIVTVCYNATDTIERCIKSVHDQDHPHLEHIVVDGASTDGTLGVVRRYQDEINRIISEPDKGIYDAMNKGLRLATGEVVGFLNADDYFAHDRVISNISHAMETHHAEAVYGDLDYVNGNDTYKVVRRWRAGDYHKGAFREGWVPPHPTFYCRKEIYDRLGGFREDFQVAADFELMLRFIEKHKIKVHYLPEVFVKMRTGGTANRAGGILLGNKEILRSFRLNDIRISPLFFLYKPIAKILQLLRTGSAHLL